MSSRTSSAKAGKKSVLPPPVHTQLAALCFRKGKDGKEVLLVTSSNGRWILPKGWPIDGLRASEAAMQEAWEEAGVKKGKVERKPLGSFLGIKRFDNGDEAPCLTKVFAVRVDKTVSDYPESDKRDRKWVRTKHAVDLVDEDGLRDILAAF